jgi:cysteine desulfurase/selenocysteine lyase
LPHKFEAGTPSIAGGIVLGTAVDYMNEVGFDNIQQQEKELYWNTERNDYEIERFKDFWHHRQRKNFVISFNIEEFIPTIYHN